MTNDVVHVGRLWKDGAYTDPGRWVKAEDFEKLDTSMTSQRDHWLEIAREKDSEIERLQRALSFWMPCVPDPGEVMAGACERLMDDAMLLAGHDGSDEQSAEALGWIKLQPPSHEPLPAPSPIERITACLEPREPGWHSVHVIEGKGEAFWAAIADLFTTRPSEKSDEHPQCSVANMWQCGSCRTFNPLLDQRCQKCGTVYVADWRAQKSSEPEPPKEVSNPGVRCKATYRGKLCCRPEGHDGEHIATGASANMRW